MLVVGIHKHVIGNWKVWTSTSANSEFIVDVKVKILAPGFTNKLVKVTVDELPSVTLLLSGTDWAKIFTPPPILEIVKVPKINPVFISTDCRIAWLEEIITLTIKLVLKLNDPPLAVIFAKPTVSPTERDEILKYPPSETNKAVDMSGSFGSWLTLIVKSEILSQFVFEILTPTVGENGIHGACPVFPPTQLKQLSIKAEPPKSPLQSVQSMILLKFWISTSPNSEVIVEVKIICDGFGFVKICDKITDCELPEVILLLSGNAVVTINIPVEVFSIVNVE